jgi:hypothetical protein
MDEVRKRTAGADATNVQEAVKQAKADQVAQSAVETGTGKKG